jgi:hypothetical protein
MEMLHLLLTKFNIQSNYNLDLKKTYFQFQFHRIHKKKMEMVKKVMSFSLCLCNKTFYVGLD